MPLARYPRAAKTVSCPRASLQAINRDIFARETPERQSCT